jgi:multidrug efflux system membrane fusion protein
MFIKGRLPGAEVPNAILVPDNAIVFDQDRKVVFTVTAENRVVVKPVQVGPMSEGLRVVLSGLEPTDTIIVRGLQRVRDGSPVEAVPAKN